jgi:hypothetical protein
MTVKPTLNCGVSVKNCYDMIRGTGKSIAINNSDIYFTQQSYLYNEYAIVTDIKIIIYISVIFTILRPN